MDSNPNPEYIPAPATASANAGLADNVAGAIAYLTVIPAILFLVLEPYNKRPFVRYHSFQCIALCVIATLLSFFMAIPVLGWIVVPLADLVLFVAWVMCVVKAYQGVLFKLPIIGPFVDNVANQQV